MFENSAKTFRPTVEAALQTVDVQNIMKYNQSRMMFASMGV
jgi:hypothetical protein